MNGPFRAYDELASRFVHVQRTYRAQSESVSIGYVREAVAAKSERKCRVYTALLRTHKGR